MSTTRPRLPEPPRGPSALDLLRSLLDDVPQLISGRVRLLALELRRARQAFAVIALMAMVAALMLLTAWFVLWGALVAALIQAGLAWGWAVLLVLVINFGGALMALLYAKSLGRFLALPATLRHLTLASHAPGKAGETAFTQSDPTRPPIPPIPPIVSPKPPTPGRTPS